MIFLRNFENMLFLRLMLFDFKRTGQAKIESDEQQREYGSADNS